MTTLHSSVGFTLFQHHSIHLPVSRGSSALSQTNPSLEKNVSRKHFHTLLVWLFSICSIWKVSGQMLGLDCEIGRETSSRKPEYLWDIFSHISSAWSQWGQPGVWLWIRLLSPSFYLSLKKTVRLVRRLVKSIGQGSRQNIFLSLVDFFDRGGHTPTSLTEFVKM